MRFSLLVSVISTLGIGGVANTHCVYDGCLAAVLSGDGGYGAGQSALQDCRERLPTVTDGPPVTITEITTVTSTLIADSDLRAWRNRLHRAAVVRRQGSDNAPSGVPDYADECIDTSQYASACSCLGVTPSTRTSTVTVIATETEVITVSRLSTGVVGTGTDSGPSYPTGITGLWSNSTSSMPETSTTTESPTETDASPEPTTTATFANSTTSTAPPFTNSTSPFPTAPFANSTSSFPTPTLTNSTTPIPTPTPGTCSPSVVQTCPFTQSCGPTVPGSPCICARASEGDGICVDRRQLCSALTPCASSFDCGAAERCAVGGCCGFPVCVRLGSICSSAEVGPIPGGIGKRDVALVDGMVLGGETDWTFG